MKKSGSEHRTLLVSWIGRSDLKGPASGSDDVGPLARILKNESFDRVLVLNDFGDDPGVSRFAGWLREEGYIDEQDCELEVVSVERCAPKAPGEIYDLVGSLLEKRAEGFDVAFAVSSGVPKMATSFYLLAATRYPSCRLIEASGEQGIRKFELPFIFKTSYAADFTNVYFKEIFRRGNGPVASDLSTEVAMAAGHDFPTLIVGEPGTGKATLARQIHARKAGSKATFAAPRAQSLSLQALEDLFKPKNAAPAMILRGIDRLDQPAQAMLASLLETSLEDKSTPLPKGFRFYATATEGLWDRVKEGTFSEDLLFLLSVQQIQLAPLRERRTEIRGICSKMLETLGRFGEVEDTFTPSAIRLLERQEWPGNLRELYSVLARATMLLPKGQLIDEKGVRQCLFRQVRPTADVMDRPLVDGFSIDETLDEVSRHYIKRALYLSGGKQSKAAEMLGLHNRQTLANRMKKLAIDPDGETSR